MCLRCEGHHETYNDTPIADQEPEYCPYCGCTELEDGMYDPDDDIDYERAIANGIDPDTADWDEIAPYKFGYDEVYCAECDHALLYGPRQYWHPELGKYSVDRPLTPLERLHAELMSQEAKGQLRLFNEPQS